MMAFQNSKIVRELGKELVEKFNKFMPEITKFFEEFEFEFHTDKFNNDIAKKIISKNEGLVEEFFNQKIWPPIFYNDKFIMKADISNLHDGKLKEYYLKSIKNKWIKEEYPEHIKLMINEIADGFDECKIFTTTFALFTLLEYRLSLAPTKNKKTKLSYSEKGEILKDTAAIQQDTNSEFFKYINNIMFKDTKDNDIEMVSRHVVHGHRLDLVNYKGMMSWIFLYDFVDKTLEIDQARVKK